MRKIIVNGEYFSVKDTALCGQLFRYFPIENKSGAYFINSGDKRCLAYNDKNDAVIECNEEDEEYFNNYFDLARDYSEIVNAANAQGGIIAKAGELGKGVRILNQNRAESLFSFIVSQNNNIPRIKVIIERLCHGAGKKHEFYGEEYYAFPTAEELSVKPLEFFKEIGLGYRAEYIKRLADNFSATFNERDFDLLPTAELKKKLVGIYGVGPKVADCVSLFGFHRADSFPVDTWIEKVYRDDLKGTQKDRTKIAEECTAKFGANAGYFQQYLFYYKRSLEKDGK